MITAAPGRRVGVINGRIVNTFPGAKVLRFCGRSGESAEPAYQFPSRNTTTTVDGSHLRHTDTETLREVGRGQSLALHNLKIGPGQKHVVRLLSGVTNVTFTAATGAGSGSPVLRLGVDSAKGGYELGLKLVNFHPGATLHLKLNVAKQLITFSSTGNSGSATYVLSVVKMTRTATIVEAPATAHLRGTESATYSYAS